MRVAEARPALRRSHARTTQRTRSMTTRRTPRSTEDRPPSAADLERLGERLVTKIESGQEAIRDQVADTMADMKAQADARQKITREALAEAAARDDALKAELERQGRRSEEILATANNGYRQLQDTQSETKRAFEARLGALEERAVPAVSEIAEHTVEKLDKAGQRRSNRQAGLTIGAGAAASGAAFMGVLNFCSNHWPFVLNVLHVVSLGLVKVTATPHE